MKLYSLLVLFAVFFNFHSRAQITERERPKEWDNLIEGGRFLDRFLPIHPIGELNDKTWGTDEVVPRYMDNGIEEKEWSYWGGNILKGDDGQFHLFVCRWAENAERGHMEWPNSIVVHAVADNSFGPFKVTQTIGKGHNPETYRMKNGTYIIYVIDGHYYSDNINGPWEYRKFEFNARDRNIPDGLSNLTFAQRENGSYIMMCRGGSIWFSKDGQSEYNLVTEERVYPPYDGRYEDPVIWRTNIQYHMIVHDWLGRIAYYMRSMDGINWKLDPGEAYVPGITKYEDGTNEDWFKYERIKMFQDEYGRATQANFAVIDTLKHNDLGSDNHSSKNIGIPLTVGKLITILDQEKITSETKTIRVKVEAEKGFNPHKDIDFESLRFGASEKVNFGLGCKVTDTVKEGENLIIIFSGEENGFTDENFTGKLLGKTTDGKLLFGYARLPWLNYLQPALSARLPILTQQGNVCAAEVEIQNFGQTTSENAEVMVEYKTRRKSLLGKAQVPPLKPFEKTVIKVEGMCNAVSNELVDVYVIIKHPNQKPISLSGKTSFLAN
jgi:hypothetical protein